MDTDFQDIQRSALKLSEKERADLAKELIQSLDQPAADDIEQAWIEEINKRKAEIESGKVSPVSGSEVHKAARDLIK